MSLAHVALCSTCGRILNVKGDCLACLVRVGFDQPLVELVSPLFGDFEIVRREDGSFWELGRGAMGVTYRAEDKVLNRSVALKVIDVPEAAGDGQMARDRFLREARAAAAFRHPNVAGVFHFGASPGGDGCYYAMELVEGETLEALVRRDGPLKVNAALEVVVQVTRSLIAAAAHGLIHRDLKPGNIMLTHRDGTAAELEMKVIDFGLAKAITDAGHEMDLTRRSGFLGTEFFLTRPESSGSTLHWAAIEFKTRDDRTKGSPPVIAWTNTARCVLGIIYRTKWRIHLRRDRRSESGDRPENQRCRG